MGKIIVKFTGKKNRMMAVVTSKQTAESWYPGEKVTGVACDEDHEVEVEDTNQRGKANRSVLRVHNRIGFFLAKIHGQVLEKAKGKETATKKNKIKYPTKKVRNLP